MVLLFQIFPSQLSLSADSFIPPLATRRISATASVTPPSGARLFPLLLPPRLARWSLALLMATWTALLIRLWTPPLPVSLVLILLCLTSGAKFIRDHSVEADRDSYWYYNMWLITAHLLPVFARIAAWRIVAPTTFLL
ncbi:Integral membrane protein [Mycena venus]|uniref:Integral membrane protein n=1 Tax=Mycena venus TaxID=2733690 RepID=A0A8H6Y5B1_9AGAR|nr:Integral membrane protein [Mycena venus]